MRAAVGACARRAYCGEGHVRAPHGARPQRRYADSRHCAPRRVRTRASSLMHSRNEAVARTVSRARVFRRYFSVLSRVHALSRAVDCRAAAGADRPFVRRWGRICAPPASFHAVLFAGSSRLLAPRRGSH
eukprot:IDg17592t1